MAGKIFINYRRDDSIGMAGRLHDRLSQTFGRDKVFLDVDHIPAGADFVAYLDSQVAECNVVLVVIGPNWLNAKDESGERRLDNPEDFVTIEIVAALARDIRVIPVLVDGARMPKAKELPDSLKSLTRRQAIEVRHAHFGHDAEALVKRMREALGEGPVIKEPNALGDEKALSSRWLELRPGRRTAVAVVAAVVLLMIGVGGYAFVRNLIERGVHQAEMKWEEEKAKAEEKRKADEAAAEQERQAKAAAEAETKRKAEEAERQRQANIRAEQDRQARAAAAEAEEKRKADEVERQRQANIRAEQERQARAAEAERQRRAEEVEQQRLATIEQERQSRAATEADGRLARERLLRPASLRDQAPATYNARFDTSKGVFVIEVTRAWAPKGADRFYNLVKNGFYDNVRFYRVISGFMAQFGINGDPAIMASWRAAQISDDPVSQSNTRGMVSFATAGANTRTSQVFINFGDNPRLDQFGFAPFGKVVSGMNVVDSLNGEYGENAPRGSGPDQSRLQAEGNAYLIKDFPRMDYIRKATIER